VTKRARVLVADDHITVAEQLRDILELEFEVVAVVGDGQALLAATQTVRPDVIVTDITMPGLDGIAAARELLRRDPGVRMVFVTVHNDPAIVKQCLAAGALGYVLKLAAGEELVPAVQAALRGERHVLGIEDTVSETNSGSGFRPAPVGIAKFEFDE
jgi:DNA-binding NarL/FixJ family response regulator